MYTIHFLLLLTTVAISTQEVTKPGDCKSVKVICACGTVTNRTYVTLEIDTTPGNTTSRQPSKCREVDLDEECSKISCQFTPKESITLSSGEYPINFTIPSGVPGVRDKRQEAPCHLEPLRFGTLRCEKWKRSISCEVECTYGHAYMSSNGSVLKYNTICRNLHNKWVPELRDCEPFLNCEVQLISPGHAVCNYPKTPPAYCEIGCVDYEINEEAPTQKFECHDESFQTKLPSCVRMKDIKIIPKPKDAVVPIPY